MADDEEHGKREVRAREEGSLEATTIQATARPANMATETPTAMAATSPTAMATRTTPAATAMAASTATTGQPNVSTAAAAVYATTPPTEWLLSATGMGITGGYVTVRGDKN